MKFRTWSWERGGLCPPASLPQPKTPPKKVGAAGPTLTRGLDVFDAALDEDGDGLLGGDDAAEGHPEVAALPHGFGERRPRFGLWFLGRWGETESGVTGAPKSPLFSPKRAGRAGGERGILWEKRERRSVRESKGDRLKR